MCQGPGLDGQGCVLVVDDDADIRESVSDVLTDEGYRVEQASNGAEALVKLADRERPPCLVFLDMMMPVMSGGELLAALARGDRLKNLPVVVVSANAVLAETGRRAPRDAEAGDARCHPFGRRRVLRPPCAAARRVTPST